MRNLIVALLLVFAHLPATAEVVVEDLLVRRKDDNVNIRVTVKNPGSSTQRGPVVVELYARPNENEGWQKIKSWNNITKLQRGFRVSRDFFDENNVYLAQLAATGSFEVKAVVSAPGLATSAEKISVYNSESGR
ncbi:MAG: hypothetical protein AB7S38_05735 [Vulcanimicrobiota bacterium]